MKKHIFLMLSITSLFVLSGCLGRKQSTQEAARQAERRAIGDSCNFAHDVKEVVELRKEQADEIASGLKERAKTEVHNKVCNS